jgi:hypothetical protein
MINNQMTLKVAWTLKASTGPITPDYKPSALLSKPEHGFTAPTGMGRLAFDCYQCLTGNVEEAVV